MLDFDARPCLLSQVPGFASSPLFQPGPAPIESTPIPWQAVWTQLMNAELRFRSAQWSPERCVAVFQRSRANVRLFALTERERMVFLRTLLGERQKAIALAADIAHSTVANTLKSGMLKLGFRTRLDAAPIAALVLSHATPGPRGSANPWPNESPSTGVLSVSHGEAGVFSVSHGEFVIASSPSPNWNKFPTTTSSEREIAMAILEGRSNKEIALARSTSPHTVENQVAALFRKVNASGRFDLLKVLYA